METHEVATELRRLATEVESEHVQPLDFGGIIAKLKALIAKSMGSEYIMFDWGHAWPTGFDSYRGDYAQICMEFGGEHRHNETVAGLMKKMEYMLGTEMDGWKGGQYTVDESKDVYVCCAGRTSKTRVVDIVRSEYGSAIIRTQEFAD